MERGQGWRQGKSVPCVRVQFIKQVSFRRKRCGGAWLVKKVTIFIQEGLLYGDMRDGDGRGDQFLIYK